LAEKTLSRAPIAAECQDSSYPKFLLVTEQDFREFTFTNAAMLHTRNNPDFFKDTVVEQAVADELGLERASPAATT
jgi:hypothetical protein